MGRPVGHRSRARLADLARGHVASAPPYRYIVRLPSCTFGVQPGASSGLRCAGRLFRGASRFRLRCWGGKSASETQRLIRPAASSNPSRSLACWTELRSERSRGPAHVTTQGIPTQMARLHRGVLGVSSADLGRLASGAQTSRGLSPARCGLGTSCGRSGPCWGSSRPLGASCFCSGFVLPRISSRRARPLGALVGWASRGVVGVADPLHMSWGFLGFFCGALVAGGLCDCLLRGVARVLLGVFLGFPWAFLGS